MTRRISKIMVIETEKPQQCDFCGKIAELRPYGPRGKKICFKCAMKDEKTTKKMFAKKMLD